MGRKHYTEEQIIGMLWEAEVLQSQSHDLSCVFIDNFSKLIHFSLQTTPHKLIVIHSFCSVHLVLSLF